jgi:hypothetical protein
MRLRSNLGTVEQTLPNLQGVVTLAQLEAAAPGLAARIQKSSNLAELELYQSIEQKSPDQYWRIKILRRMSELSQVASIHLRYVKALLSSQQTKLAADQFGLISSVELASQDYAEVEALLHIANGNAQLATTIISERIADPSKKEALCVKLIDELFRRGKIDLTSAPLRLLQVHTQSGYTYVVKAIEVEVAKTGASAAASLLEQEKSKFHFDKRQLRLLNVSILVARGKFQAAFRLAHSAIVEDNRAVEFLPLAFVCAMQADLINDFEQLLLLLRKRLGNLTDLIKIQASQSIISEDHETTALLLNELSQRSTTLYQSAQFEEALQAGDVERIEALYVTLERDLILTAEQTRHLAEFKYIHAADQQDCQNVCALLEPHLARNAGNPAFVALYCKSLIGAGREAQLEDTLSDVPQGLQRRSPLAPFFLYLVHRAGDQKRVKSGWTRLLQREIPQSLSSEESPPVDLKVRFKARKNELLLFSCVYNGMDYLPRFLSHYRDLGVTHFFVVDNASSDGTLEFVMGQKDISVFSAAGSFRNSASGMYWINHLLRRFGSGYWCFHVDYDEFFVFPGQNDGRSLAALLSEMEKIGAESIPALQLDLYPERLAEGGQLLSFDDSQFIDSDYTFLQSEVPPYELMQGGVRARITGQRIMLTKAPLIKMSDGFAYLQNNHSHTGVPVAPARAALLHYKFIGNVHGRLEEAIKRQEHFLGARTYRALSRSTNNDLSLRTSNTVRYQGTRQLEELGIIKDIR